MLFAWITDPNVPLAPGTLTLLEIVLDRQYYFPFLVVASFLAQRAHARVSGVGGSHGHASGAAGIHRLVTRLTNPLLQYSVRKFPPVI